MFKDWKITTPNKVVVYDRPDSHCHIDNPDLLVEAVSKIIFDKDMADGHVKVHEVDMGRTVGTTDCVRTTISDRITYEKRFPRKNLSRMVFDRQPEPTSKITLVLKKVGTYQYICLTCYIGSAAPKEPGDPSIKPEELLESLKFWADHALRIESLSDNI